MADKTVKDRMRRYMERKRAEGQVAWTVHLSAEHNAAASSLMEKHPDLFPNKSETMRKALAHLCSAYGIDEAGQGQLFAADPAALDHSTGKGAANES
jgi:Arc/MetJ-type ribon-helix-helix transcriptional regulator